METIQKHVEVTDSNFQQEVLSAEQPVLVDFGADWCAPCVAIGPIIESLAVDYAGKAKIAKLDVDTHPQTTAQYGVKNLPTLLIFKGGKVVDKIVGAVPKKIISSKLDQYL